MGLLPSPAVRTSIASGISARTGRPSLAASRATPQWPNRCASCPQFRAADVDARPCLQGDERTFAPHMFLYDHRIGVRRDRGARQDAQRGAGWQFACGVTRRDPPTTRKLQGPGPHRSDLASAAPSIAELSNKGTFTAPSTSSHQTRATPGVKAQRSPTVPVSMKMHGRKTRNAGQVKLATGNPPDLSGSTWNAKPAPLKSETPHEIGGQLI